MFSTSQYVIYKTYFSHNLTLKILTEKCAKIFSLGLRTVASIGMCQSEFIPSFHSLPTPQCAHK